MYIYVYAGHKVRTVAVMLYKVRKIRTNLYTGIYVYPRPLHGSEKFCDLPLNV